MSQITHDFMPGPQFINQRVNTYTRRKGALCRIKVLRERDSTKSTKTNHSSKKWQHQCEGCRQTAADSGPSSTSAFTATLMSGNTSGNLYKIWCSFVSCQSAKYTLRDQCANDFYRSIRIAFVGKKSRQWRSSRDLIGDIKDAQTVHK